MMRGENGFTKFYQKILLFKIMYTCINISILIDDRILSTSKRDTRASMRCIKLHYNYIPLGTIIPVRSYISYYY